jgi:hypothetical protein
MSEFVMERNRGCAFQAKKKRERGESKTRRSVVRAGRDEEKRTRTKSEGMVRVRKDATA